MIPPKKKQKVINEALKAGETSKKFKSIDSDITIISSDGVLFELHKANLIGSSEVFANMLATGSSDVSCDDDSASRPLIPTLNLTESYKVLERLFEFIYPTSLQNRRDEISKRWWPMILRSNVEIAEDIVALDKYKVIRGIEFYYNLHYNTTKRFHFESPEEAHTDTLAKSFKFGDHFGFDDLMEAVAFCVASQDDISTQRFIKHVSSSDDPDTKSGLCMVVSRENLLKISMYLAGVDAAFRDARLAFPSDLLDANWEYPDRPELVCVCQGSCKTKGPVIKIMKLRSPSAIEALRDAGSHWRCRKCSRQWEGAVDNLHSTVYQELSPLPYK